MVTNCNCHVVLFLLYSNYCKYVKGHTRCCQWAPVALSCPCRRLFWPTEHIQSAEEVHCKRNHCDWPFSYTKKCKREEMDRESESSLTLPNKDGLHYSFGNHGYYSMISKTIVQSVLIFGLCLITSGIWYVLSYIFSIKSDYISESGVK